LSGDIRAAEQRQIASPEGLTGNCLCALASAVHAAFVGLPNAVSVWNRSAWRCYLFRRRNVSLDPVTCPSLPDSDVIEEVPPGLQLEKSRGW